MLRLFFAWSFVLIFVGESLCFVQSTLGQVTRDLYDWRQQTPTVIPPAAAPNTSTGRMPLQSLSPHIAPAPGTPGGNTGTVTVPAVTPFLIPDGLNRIVPSVGSVSFEELPRSPKNTEQSAEEKMIASKIAAVLEETEDEREERSLANNRKQAEQIIDPEQREAAMKLAETVEANYNDRLSRRKTHEAGAYLFYHRQLKGHLLDEGWCQLFDGYTDYGWNIQTDGPYAGGIFTFGNHEIVSDPWHPGLIYTQIPFNDISVRFDYWAEKDSEVFLLMNTPADTPCLHTSCYTFVLNSSKANRPRGLLLERHGLSIPDLRAMHEMQDAPNSIEEGSWHSAVVRVEGNDLRITIDNRNTQTYFVLHPLPAGHVAFLVAKGKARFLNILWQPTQTVPLFNADDFAENQPWRVLEGGELSVTSGKFRLYSGSAESRDMYGNFMLQMQYYQGQFSGQSSLFIRAVPECKDTGYEISLQNYPQRKDREAVRGVDAGGFRLIKDSRYVRTQDLQWNYLTVVAMNRQIQTWVNGVPVCDIHDKRAKPDRTPSDRFKDPFLVPGTVRLSVPKSNTEFYFRNLLVAPML